MPRDRRSLRQQRVTVLAVVLCLLAFVWVPVAGAVPGGVRRGPGTEPDALITVTKTVTSPVSGIAHLGDVITYDVNITTAFPLPLQVTNFEDPNASCGPPPEVVFDAQPGLVQCEHLVVADDVGGTYTNVVSMSVGGDPVLSNEAVVTVVEDRADRPDGRVRKGTGALVGNDVYNTTGLGQSRSGAASVGSAVTYTVSAQNDGNLPSALIVKGLGSTDRFRVRYFDGAADVTAGVTAGTYVTPALGVGERHNVQVLVTPRPTAPRGATLTRLVTVKAGATPAVKDVVKTVTTRI